MSWYPQECCLCVPDGALYPPEKTCMNDPWDDFWKEDWDQTRRRYLDWWQHDGLILHVTAPRENPNQPVAQDTGWRGGNSGIDANYPLTGREPVSIETAWLDAERRAQLAEIYIANTYWGGEAIPYFDTHIGPGSLGMFLGARTAIDAETVWYYPCITDPDSHPPLVFDPQQRWVQAHKAIIEAGLRHNQGHYLVGMPDLIENIDVLAALRGTPELLLDMIERPEWVTERVAEINRAFFAAFDMLFDLIRDPWGGNAFCAFKIWGPGKTAKVQCDMAAMISPKMFRQFVVPALTEQCAWLDFAMYHLDGTQAVVQLDHLLAIEPLHAVEWTPQAGRPQGGSPEWYAMYRRILAAGKSVQAIGVEPDEVIPLLDAIGGRGVYIMTETDTEAEARALVEAVEAYR